jgi:hypothetical protein
MLKNKYLNFLALICAVLFSAGCADRQARTVVGQQTAAPGVDFQEYRTYSWATQVVDADGAVFFLNDLLLKGEIMNAVAHEMNARGYQYLEHDPDLIVNFRVFDEPVEIRNMEDMGADFWAPNEFRRENTGVNRGVTGLTGSGTSSVPNPQGDVGVLREQPHQLEAGSIFVQMADKGTGQVVWQGFASGLTDGTSFSKNEGRINAAVSKIFDEYPHEAPQLSERQERR